MSETFVTGTKLRYLKEKLLELLFVWWVVTELCCWNLDLKVLAVLETVNRWRTVVSATWKYDDPRLNMSHEGTARVWHVQPRVVIFPCRTNYRVSYVLSSDQLQESWIICKLKSFPPLYLHDLNTQDRRVIFSVSKTLCDFGHKKFCYRRTTTTTTI